MSEFCSCSNYKMAVLLLASWILSCQFLQTLGGRSLTPDACDLLVSHGAGRLHHEYSVSVKLVDGRTNEEQSCYNLNRDYYIRLRTNASTIKGFLMIQDKSKRYGEFAMRTIPPHLPPNVGYGLCGDEIPSACHECGDRTCNLGKVVDIPYRSPNGRNILEFGYSVVFEYAKYVENKTAIFLPCSVPPSPSPEVSTEVPTSSAPKSRRSCNTTEFNLNNNPEQSSTTCSNDVTFITNIIHKEKGNTYDCRYADTRNSGQGVKRVDCFSGCQDEKTGKVLCCKVRFIQNVTRQFSCTAHTGTVQNPIIKYLDVIQERRCECFPCEDVCPTARPTSAATVEPNSVEGGDSKSNQTNEIEP